MDISQQPAPGGAAVATYPIVAVPAPADLRDSASRVLRNTYALLSMTLLFSASVAATSLALQLPAPGILCRWRACSACCSSCTR